MTMILPEYSNWANMLTSSPQPNYPALAQACNYARNGDDVQDSWDSVTAIIEQFGTDEGNFSLVAGPGFWNDPDMVMIPSRITL